VCDALLHISKENKREVRKRAEDEKVRLSSVHLESLTIILQAKLRHMHDSSLIKNTTSLENVPCALIPAQFLKSWRQWLNRPTEARPEKVDNTAFICEHNLLAVDPNSPLDFDSSLAVIKRKDWDVLETLQVPVMLCCAVPLKCFFSYPSGPLITVEKRLLDDETEHKFVHDIPVCSECNLRR
jgi:hypothetical protein